jgi:hypothetical protein
VIAGDKMKWGDHRESLQVAEAALKLPMPGPLGQVAGDDDDLRGQRREEPFKRGELQQIRADAKVDIGEVSDDDFAHQTTRTR